MITFLLGVILLLVGLFCLIKPDNFLLPYLGFGGIVNAKNYINEKGKTKQLLIWMRTCGVIAFILGIVFILAYLKII